MRGFILLAMMGMACAATLEPGECQNDSISNETWCAAIPNLNINLTLNASDPANNAYQNPIYGISISAVGNETIINIINNTTIIQQCNATSATLWANSTDTYNNATITCLGNLTIIENITNVTNVTIQQCNATSATLWANSTATLNNATFTCLGNITASCPASTQTLWANSVGIFNNQTISCLKNSTDIPSNYCYQNIAQDVKNGSLFINPACNITTKCEACVQAPSCPTCPVCQTYNPSACDEVVGKVRANLTAQLQGMSEQLGSKDGIISSQSTALTQVGSAIDQKVNAAVTEKTGNVDDMLTIMPLIILGGAVMWIVKSRTSPVAAKYGKVVSANEVDDLLNAHKGEETKEGENGN